MTRRALGHAALVGLGVALAAATGWGGQPRKRQPRPDPVAAPTAAASSAPVTPASIAVTVVEIAGSQAYLQPGASAGVRRGAKVLLGGKEYTVVETSDSFAVVEVGGAPPREQDRGQALAVAAADDKARELSQPRPLSEWSQAWPDAPAPARSQAPRFVPLGDAERDRRYDVTFSMTTGGMLPSGQPGGGIVHADLGARVHAEPFDAPVTLDLDASLERWFAGDLGARSGAAARPLFWVRELLVGYSGSRFSGAVGRMPYAASTLGTLDGARVSAPVGEGFYVGAFGGLLPNPLGGEPSLDAQRFGIEARYARPDLDLRPEAAVVVSGSTFLGRLDERELSGVLGLYPGLSRVGAHFEVSGFDADNPWKAKPIELTGAGLDGSFRRGILELGARFDLRQPERSRWIASFLPASWLCRTTPAAPGAPPGPEPCDGSVSTRGFGSIDAALLVDNVSVAVGATTIHDLTQTGAAPEMAGGFLTGRVARIARVLRIDASGSYSGSTFVDMYGGSAGPGLTLLGDELDLSAYYRNTTLQYRTGGSSLVQRGLGANVMLFPNAALLLSAQGEAISGNDVHAFVFFGTMTLRAR
jgi:hypothetical protein